MSVRNLEILFKPKSVALIGAEGAMGKLLIRNLLNESLRGAVMPVSQRQQALEGVLTYATVAALPHTPDIAVIASPLPEMPAIVRDLGERGTRAAVLLATSQFTPQRQERKALKQQILDAARPYLLRLLGPGCLGLVIPACGFNATLSHAPPRDGHVALVTQSGGVARAALDWARARQLGFSHLICLGAAIDVDFGDTLDYLAGEYRTRAILLHIERVRDARKFMSAARRAARMKPIVVLKPHEDSRDGVPDYVYDAAFRRAGLVRVDDLEELFNSVETLTAAKPMAGDRMAVLGNSRSLGLLAAETLQRFGGKRADFSAETRTSLEGLIDPLGYLSNPLDLGDHANADVYDRAIGTVLGDPNVDAVLAINAPSVLSDAVAIADAVAKHQPSSKRRLFACWLGPEAGARGRQRLLANAVPTYESPDGAVRAFMRLVEYKRNQELLMETPPSIPECFSPAVADARQIVNRALQGGRDRLNEYESLRLLQTYDIPVVETHLATTPAAAVELARPYLASEPRRPVALKIVSPDIAHKSEVRGVALDIGEPDTVLAEAHAMIERLREVRSDARLDGFVVQPMEPASTPYELTLGVRHGGNFGPILHFGHGGTERRSIGDIAYGLPPLNMHLAREMMSRTRIFPMLEGVKLRHANLDALALTLLKVSQMAIDLHELMELDINPLWAGGRGVVALDAIVRVEDRPAVSGRLAIRAYPKELEEQFELPDGRRFLIRPILPEDEPALRALAKRSPPEALRLRFFQPIREISHRMAAQLTQIDYHREMALLITDLGVPGQADIWAVVRFTADPDLERAEYAIFIDDAVIGLGLGPLLMRRIINYAKDRGIKELYGEVLRENESMLTLDRAFGFKVKAIPDDPGIMHVSLALTD